MPDTKDEILNQNNSGVGGNTGTDTGTDINPQKNNADANPQAHENGGTGEQNGDNSMPVNNGSALTGGNNKTVVNQPTNTEGNNKQDEKQMSYVDMLNQLNPYKAPTQEELEKQRKKEKRDKLFASIGDTISSLANLYFTTKGAPNAFEPQNSMYEKTKQRWDKLNNEQKENSRAYLAAYMQAKQADEANNRDSRNWQHQLKREGIEDQRDSRNWQHQLEREGIEDQRYNQNIEHRDKREQVEDAHWDKNFQMQEKQFNESVRQFNVTSAQNAQRIKMESQRLAREMNTDKVTFALGTGKGTISIPTNALNAANVSYVFNKLPAEVRATCQGEAIYDSEKRHVVGYKDPTTEAMLVCIGANIEGNESAQNALREIGGQKPKNSSDNTPPSSSNDNTPPSRRKK